MRLAKVALRLMPLSLWWVLPAYLTTLATHRCREPNRTTGP